MEFREEDENLWNRSSSEITPWRCNSTRGAANVRPNLRKRRSRPGNGFFANECAPRAGSPSDTDSYWTALAKLCVPFDARVLQRGLGTHIERGSAWGAARRGSFPASTGSISTAVVRARVASCSRRFASCRTISGLRRVADFALVFVDLAGN